MTTIADMVTIRHRRKLEHREAELRALAAELRQIPRQLPPPVPPTLISMALARQNAAAAAEKETRP